MRIGLLSTCWVSTPPASHGGIEWTTSFLERELVARGHEVTLFATGDSRAHGSLWYLHESARPGLHAIDEIRHAGAACAHAAAVRCDIVHNFNFGLGIVPLCLSPVPTVTTVPVPLAIGGRSQFLDLYLSLGRAHPFVSVSRSQRLNAPDVNWVGTVYNGVDVGRFRTAGRRTDDVLFLGRVTPVKCPHLAIDAARRAGRRITIAGPVHPSDLQYFAAEIQPRLGEGCTYVGAVGFDAKVELLARASAVLMPLDVEEAFGMVAVEAMACGTPVVAFPRGALREVVADGETGYLVKDVEGMAAALENLHTLEAEACRARVEAHFSSRAMASGYLTVYEQVLASALQTANPPARS